MLALSTSRLFPYLLLLFPRLCFSFTSSHDRASHASPSNPPHEQYFHTVSDRKQFIQSTIRNVFGGGLLFLNYQQAIAAVDIKPLSSVQEAVDIISNTCNRRYLYNIVSSDYNFLYRGLNPSEAKRSTVQSNQPFDLLDPDTYGSDAAASYFSALEKNMRSKNSPVLPSNGHLATTCPKAAANWGVAASIWPIGEDGVHFAWFEDGGLFWPRNEEASKEIIFDGRECGKISLDDALVGDAWEILFRADSGFVTVPTKLDTELRKGLQRSFVI